MRVTFFVRGEFGPDCADALVDINQDGDYSRFSIALEDKNRAGGLVSYGYTLEELVRVLEADIVSSKKEAA